MKSEVNAVITLRPPNWLNVFASPENLSTTTNLVTIMALGYIDNILIGV